MQVSELKTFLLVQKQLSLSPSSENNSIRNVSRYDVIVWCKTTSTEQDTGRLLHRCLFSPAHWFALCHVVNRRYHSNKTIESLRITRCLEVPKCGKTVFALEKLYIIYIYIFLNAYH